MARILFSAFSNVWIEDLWDAHSEGFISALQRNGNDLLCIRTNHFVKKQITSELKDSIDYRKVIYQIRDFDPELVITYNNSLPGIDILQTVSCPVIVYPADVPAFWCNTELIAEHLDQYYFFQTAKQIEKAIRDMFPSVKDSQFIPFGYVTDLRAQSIPQDINVSFVGSIGNYSEKFVEYFQALDEKNILPEKKNQIKDSFYKALDDFSSDTMQSLDSSLIPFTFGLKRLEPTAILCLTCQERMRILTQLTDLGLRIYGWAGSWAKVMEYDHDLFRCYNYTPSVTLYDNTLTYNRSKISLNLPHGNNVDGFSWRVCDILASNAVLLSVRKPDLQALMNPYFPNFPMFESPGEARSLVIKLLRDDCLRHEITAASQQMIEDHCRFEPRIVTLQEAFPKLIFHSDNIGKVQYLSHIQCLSFSSDAAISRLKHMKFLKKMIKYIVPYAFYIRLYEKLHSEG